MAWGAAIAGAAVQGGSGILGAHTGAFGAERQMKFQKKVLKNRYQWTVEDLRKAGINPLMAVHGMQAGMAQGAQPPRADWGGGAGDIIAQAPTRAATAKHLKQQAEERKVHIDLLKEQIQDARFRRIFHTPRELMNLQATTEMLYAHQNLYDEQSAEAAARRRLWRIQGDFMQMERPWREAEKRGWSKDWAQLLREYGAPIGYGMGLLSPMAQGARGLFEAWIRRGGKGRPGSTRYPRGW